MLFWSQEKKSFYKITNDCWIFHENNHMCFDLNQLNTWEIKSTLLCFVHFHRLESLLSCFLFQTQDEFIFSLSKSNLCCFIILLMMIAVKRQKINFLNTEKGGRPEYSIVLMRNKQVPKTQISILKYSFAVLIKF